VRRVALLLGAGLVSEAVYLAVTIRLPWWRYGGRLGSWSAFLGPGWAEFVLCLIGIGVLMAAYLAGWWAVRRGRVRRWLVWAFAIVFAATLFWLMPITSDLFTYLSQAHLLTDLGLNPLLVATLDIPSDPLLLAYPSLYGTKPSVYGPAWSLIAAPGTLGQHDVVGGLLYLKGLAVLAYLACGWLLERILRRIRPEAVLEGLYLFAWNPLVLLMAAGDGHNDIVMATVVLAALWLLLTERWALAFGSLTLSIWIKYVGAIFFPLFAVYAWKRLQEEGGGATWRVVAQCVLVVVAVSILVFVPFWSSDLISGLAGRLLRPVNWQGGAGGASSWALGAGLALFVLIYLALTWRVARQPASFERVAGTCFVAALLVFVLGAARSQPWHLIWPAALAGLSNRRWAWSVVVGLSAVLLIVQVWVEWGAPGWGATF